MIVITRTPVRISFLGGGTDYAEFFTQHGGGEVLATAIDKYSYLKVNTLHDFFEYQLRVGYSRTELVQRVEDVQHPSVRECLKYTRTPLPIEINYTGDLPSRTGLGSSSSFTVGLLNALHAYNGQMSGAEQLAREALEVEHEWIKERVGYQDQCMAAYGGFRHIIFRTPTEIEVRPVPMNGARLRALREHIVVFYTGLTRFANDVLKEQIKKTSDGTNTAALIKMRGMVQEGVRLLTTNAPLAEFGELLHASWELKQSLSSAITTPAILEAYERARRAGAVGGKLLGAGGGGFLLFIAPPARQAAVRQALAPMKELPFEFEPLGSQIIFYHP